jgi:hypothetical protein
MISAQDQYLYMHQILNEKQWRQYLAIESQSRGNLALVAREAGVSENTIRHGIDEIDKGNLYHPGDRIRVPGAGPKSRMESDPTLKRDLEALLEPKGDPMSLVRWTTKSIAHLVTALKEKHHHFASSSIYRYLKHEGFSMKATKKNIEGNSHPDRDQQFHHLKEECDRFQTMKCPIISVDCKKKELIGNFKNQGKEWQPKGENSTVVNVYDFRNLSDGKAVPYGIYDIVHNQGFVNVGIDHDTAEFAVESIRRWWQTTGRLIFPNKHQLLITADGGGSNGSRNRLWKRELQQLSNENNMTITVCHYPPATSKWNLIEHRLFSYISINWRAKPLISLETVIELLNHTTTKHGLTITAIKDDNLYQLGKKITATEMATLNICRHEFHGDWNYTISPQKKP